MKRIARKHLHVIAHHQRGIAARFSQICNFAISDIWLGLVTRIYGGLDQFACAISHSSQVVNAVLLPLHLIALHLIAQNTEIMGTSIFGIKS